MGVYIKDMKLPKNCYGCPFFVQVDYWKHNERSAVCPNFGAHDCQASCRKCWLDWLKQEISNE